MPRKRETCWSRTIEAHGIAVRIYERTPGSPLYLSVVVNGRKDRKSLKHRDRQLAEEQARELAAHLAEAQLTGAPVGSVTLGRVFAWYRRDRIPLLTAKRAGVVETTMQLFTEAWGSGLPLDDLSQTHVDRYVTRRRSGELVPESRRPSEENNWKARGVRDGAIAHDFRNLSAIFNAAVVHRVSGRRFLALNPLLGLTWPREKNPRRPVASEQRYRLTLAKAGTVDPMGRLGCILSLARYTGRREGAICALRVSDVLLTPAAIRAALARLGRDERLADHCPHGAIRWRGETDKMGYDEVTPLGRDARAALDAYMRGCARVGEAPLFPAENDDGAPIRTDVASTWLLRAERLARLPKLERGVWHPYRRLWAVERKHLPDVDVAAAGGWRGTQALRLSYQQADPETLLRVVEAG